MLFSSLTFLCCFLPFVFIVYYLINPSLRNTFLLLASLLFYAWGEPRYLFLMIVVIILNYISGILLDKINDTYRKSICVISVFANLSILFNYKYLDFVIENLNIFLSNQLELHNVALPIGISFYIFQSLSYTIDVYRKLVPAQYNLLKFSLYVSLFPQLVAGPIVKYKEVMQYLESRDENIDDIVYGFRRFIIGLGKKVIFANTMGEVVDKIFSAGPSEITVTVAWLGTLAFALQMFFDFSGYSDMAIGLGRIFGFKFQENFNYPFTAKTMTEFWRKWHISLTSWFTQYLYIPLGGNRVSAFRQDINLIVVFIATGIWHGANWTFVAWGLWNVLFLLIEKKTLLVKREFSTYVNICLHVYVIMVVLIQVVFFRSDSISFAIEYLSVMFGLSNNTYIPFGFEYYFNNKVFIVGILSGLCCYNWEWSRFDKYKFYVVLKDVFLILTLLYCIASTAASGYNPFIYFKF